MTYVLGISCFYHDSAAALIHSGKIISAVQERFSRKKHDARFPVHSIKYILKNSKIKLSDISQIVYYESHC